VLTSPIKERIKMTFPVKKRINTELFIDREMMLYIQKIRRDRIKVIRSRNIGPLRRG